MRTTYYFDKELQQVVEGYPPQPERYGTSAFVIGDTIDAYYHPGAGVWVESRKVLQDIDRATGCITTDKKLPPCPSRQKQLEAERKKDAHAAVDRAIEAIDSGAKQFTEDERAYHAKANQEISVKYGFDAFNVAGKKNDKRGKLGRKRR